MTTMKKYAFILLSLLICASCSDLESPVLSTEEHEELTIGADLFTTVTIGQEQTTRASNPFTEDFYIYHTQSGTTDRNNAVAVTSNKFNIKDASNNTIYWDNIGGVGASIDLIGVYPKTTQAPTATNLSSFTWSVLADQTTAANYKNSDLLISNRIMGYTLGKQKTSVENLEFKHVLSKATIKLVAGTGFTSADFNPANLRLLDMNSECTMTVGAGATASVGISALNTSSTIFPLPISTSTGDPKTVTYEAIVLPGQTLASEFLRFDISIGASGNTYTVERSVVLNSFAFQPGKNHIFTIKVNKVDAEVFTTIADWTDYGEIAGVDIHIDFEDNSGGVNTGLVTDADLYIGVDGQKSKYRYTASDTWTPDPNQIYWDHINPVGGLYANAVLINKDGGTGVNADAEDIYTGKSQELDKTYKQVQFASMAHPFCKVNIVLTSDSKEPNYVDLTKVVKVGLTTMKEFDYVDLLPTSPTYLSVLYNNTPLEKTLSIVSGDLADVSGVKEYTLNPVYVEPNTVAANAYYLSVHHKDGTLENEYKLKNGTTALTFVANHTYTITVNLKKTEVTYSVKVEGWKAGDPVLGEGTITD